MDNKDTINRFKRFMKDKGAWALYCHEQKNYSETNLSSFFKNTPPDNFITSAFLWKTNIRLWANLTKEWREMLIEEQTN